MGALMLGWLRVLSITAVGLFPVFSLTACEDFTTWATVTAVQEVETAEAQEEAGPHEEDLRAPPPHFELELRLDDGEMLSLQHNGARRYMPGERVRLLKDDAGELLL
jgi:hypothetical protein